jgi:hypothetical protein
MGLTEEIPRHCSSQQLSTEFPKVFRDAPVSKVGVYQRRVFSFTVFRFARVNAAGSGYPFTSPAALTIRRAVSGYRPRFVALATG